MRGLGQLIADWGEEEFDTSSPRSLMKGVVFWYLIVAWSFWRLFVILPLVVLASAVVWVIDLTWGDPDELPDDDLREVDE